MVQNSCMAWEWVPPMAGAVVAIGGIIGGVVTAKGSRKDARALAQQTNEHQVALAREQRQQQRFADAHLELLTMVEMGGQWVTMVRPIIDTDPPQPLRRPPSLDQQARVDALTAAYCSDEVKAQVDRWRDVVRQVTRATEEIAAAIAQPDAGLDRTKPWRELDFVLRPAERAARKALADQIAFELRGGSRPA
jgi:hypothetical protein